MTEASRGAARAHPWLPGLATAVDRPSPGTFWIVLAIAMLIPQHFYLANAMHVLSRGSEYGGSPSYGQIASSLVHSGRFSLDGVHFTTYRPPLYPWFLAAIMKLAGADWLPVAAILQSLITWFVGLLTLALVWRLTRERMAVVVGAILWAGHLFLHNDVLGQSETSLYLLFTVLFFLVLQRGSRLGVGSWMALGVLAGLAHLTRPTGALLVPILAGLALVVWRRRGVAAAASAALAFGLPLILVVLPWQWTIRRELGVVTASSSLTGGLNFYKGNNRDLLTMVPRVWYDPYHPWVVRDLRAHGIPPRDDAAVDRFLVHRTFEYIRAEPGQFAQGVMMKLFALHSPAPTPFGHADFVEGRHGELVLEHYQRVDTPARRFETVHWAIVEIGVVAFLILLARGAAGVSAGAVAPMGAFVLLTTIVHALTVGSTRYRLPMDPFLILAAAIGWGVLLRWAAGGAAETAAAPQPSPISPART